MEIRQESNHFHFSVYVGFIIFLGYGYIEVKSNDEVQCSRKLSNNSKVQQLTDNWREYFKDSKVRAEYQTRRNIG